MIIENTAIRAERHQASYASEKNVLKERAKRTSGADTTGTGREGIGLAASEEVCMMVESKGVREYEIRI